MTATFLILASLTVAGTAAAMGLRNAVHCVLALTVGFAGVAALYLQLDAQFVGFTQIMVYVGAVAILAVFAIMMTHSPGPRSRPPTRPTGSPGSVVAAAVFAVLAWAIAPAQHVHASPAAATRRHRAADRRRTRCIATSCRWKSWACCSPPPSSAPSSSRWTAKQETQMSSLKAICCSPSLLFSIGLAGALTRRNAILVLIGIELMLNAANLNFIAFWRYGPHPRALTGIMFAIFSISVAAAEAAVGLGHHPRRLPPLPHHRPRPDELAERLSIRRRTAFPLEKLTPATPKPLTIC